MNVLPLAVTQIQLLLWGGWKNQTEGGGREQLQHQFFDEQIREC